MLIRLALKLTEVSPRFRRFLWRRWYQFVAGYKNSDWKFMNYGYSSLNGDSNRLGLQPEDEPNRFAIQLYHHVAGAVPLEGREVLEVGSGRGGGAAFVKRYLRPKQMTGVDYSPKAVRFANDQQRMEGLTFVQGDAEKLPFADQAFDAVLNVESSHCYGSMPAFLGEVKRVLRPGGHFLFADLRPAADRNRLHQYVVDSGLEVLAHEEITANVLEALRRDSERKLGLIEKSVNKRLVHAFRQFAAIEGSETYDQFKTGGFVYVRYLLRK